MTINRIATLGLLAILSLSLLPSCANRQKDRGVYKSKGWEKPTHQIAVMEKQMEAHINAYRASLGKKPFRHDKRLANLARQHSQFMAANPGKFRDLGYKKSNISHQDFTYRRDISMLYYGMDISENVVAGNHSPSQAPYNLFRAWLRSKPHHTNIKTNWNYSGVGAAIGKGGKVYFTQLFGAPKTAPETEYERSLMPGAPRNW